MKNQPMKDHEQSLLSLANTNDTQWSVFKNLLCLFPIDLFQVTLKIEATQSSHKSNSKIIVSINKNVFEKVLKTSPKIIFILKVLG